MAHGLYFKPCDSSYVRNVLRYKSLFRIFTISQIIVLSNELLTTIAGIIESVSPTQEPDQSIS